ncbi:MULTISPECIES: hypothetical protein [Bacillus]|nr:MULTISPECIES: hypothetical protein [Bacillus]
MNQKETLEIVKKIIELDLLRDEYWESLSEKAGEHAFELLRIAQNS